MSRQEDFIQAGIDYRFEHGKPMAIGGDNFADVANEMNRCKDYEAGAEYGYQYAVDKACEWLRNNMEYWLGDYNLAEDELEDNQMHYSAMLEALREAMED